jgi:hypothetical protein
MAHFSVMALLQQRVVLREEEALADLLGARRLDL